MYAGPGFYQNIVKIVNLRHTQQRQVCILNRTTFYVLQHLLDDLQTIWMTLRLRQMTSSLAVSAAVPRLLSDPACNHDPASIYPRFYDKRINKTLFGLRACLLAVCLDKLIFVTFELVQ